MCLSAGEGRQRRQLWRCGQEEQPGSGWDGAASAAVLSFPTVATTVFTALVIRGTPNLMTWSLPHSLASSNLSWSSSSPTALPGLIPQPEAHRAVLMFRQLQELLCNAENMCLGKKFRLKTSPYNIFLICLLKQKRYMFSMKPTVANEYPSPDFELGLYCIILVHLF